MSTGVTGSADLDLTAAICTHGRQELLRDALGSLVAQTPPPAEILVVENAPEGEKIAQMLAREFPRVHHVVEPVLGLNFARNRALRVATSEVVAFLDDDARAEPSWAATLWQVFDSDASVGLCTGRVTARRLETASQRLFEANGGYDRGTEKIRLPDDASRKLHGRRAPLIAWAASVGNGTSYAVRRRLALRLGSFDEALDLGAALPGGGDHDMLWRVLRSGHRVVYEPEARAEHEHRREMTAVAAQISGQQRGFIAMLTKSLRRESGSARRSILFFLCWRLLKPGARVLRRLLGRDPLPLGLLIRMWGQCWSGLWAYRAGTRVAELRRQEVS